jgi:hypothetical protein
VWIVENEVWGNGSINGNGVNSSADICHEGENPQSASRIHVRGNRVRGYLTSLSIAIFDANDSDAIGNTVCQGNNGTGGGGYGILMYSHLPVQHNIVSNNSVANTWGSGIYVAGSDYSSVTSNTTYNTCQGESDASLPVGAISVNTNNGVVVSNNVVHKSGKAGIAMSGGTATGASMTACAAPSTTNWPVVGHVVSNNYITDTATYGLWIDGNCHQSVFSGNVVNNSAPARGLGHGLYAYGAVLDGIRIVGNSFDTGTGAGIAIGGLTTGPDGVTNSLVANNYVRNFAGQSIIVGGGAHVAVIGNAVAYTTMGIDFRASNSVVEFNSVACSSVGILCTGASCRVGSNTLDTTGSPLSITNSASYGENNRLNGGSAMRGVVSMSGGTVTAGTSEVQAGDTIRLNRKVPSGTLGHLSYAIAPGASITITSTSATENSDVEWEIVH